MKSFTESLKGDKEAYQAFFKKALKKFGVDEPDQLSGDKKKEFFNYVDKNWKADNETDVDEGLSPLSKGTRKHIDRVRDDNNERLKKLRASKRKKNPTFMDKFKKGFKKEDLDLDEALNKDWIKAVNNLSKKMGASVAKSSKGGIIPFASRVGKTTNIGYTDSKGKRHVVFSTDKPLSNKEEDKMMADIRKKFAIKEARVPSDDNFKGAGYSGEKGFKNKAVASRGGSTAGRNRSRAAQRKAQEGMIDAAIKQDLKAFRKHAVAMSKSIASQTKQKEPIQTMWTKEKAKALKDGTWFKMSYQQQKKIEGDKPRYEPFDWGQRESVEDMNKLNEAFDVPNIDYSKLKDYKGFQNININKMIKANNFAKFNVKTIQDVIVWLNMVAMQWKAGNLKEEVEIEEAVAVDMRTKGYKEAVKRALLKKKKYKKDTYEVKNDDVLEIDGVSSKPKTEDVTTANVATTPKPLSTMRRKKKDY